MLAGRHYIWINRFHVDAHLRYVMFAAQMNIWADDPIVGRDDFESALNLLPTLLLRYSNLYVNKLLHQHNTYQYISIYLIITSVSYMYTYVYRQQFTSYVYDNYLSMYFYNELQNKTINISNFWLRKNWKYYRKIIASVSTRTIPRTAMSLIATCFMTHVAHLLHWHIILQVKKWGQMSKAFFAKQMWTMIITQCNQTCINVMNC